jgi:hypothetical protein
VQNPGDRRSIAGGFEQPGSVCRRNEGHRFRLREPLAHGKDAPGLCDDRLTRGWPFHPRKANRRQLKATVTTS